MKFIAHRGLRSESIKENSINAFKNAINNPRFSGFEFDIRETKDKNFVVNHNAFIKDDLISLKSAKELKRKYNIPTLSEVLKLKTDKIFLIEIKNSHISYANFIKIIKRFPNQNIYIMSFHNKVIHKLKEYNIKVKLGVLNYVFNSEEQYQLDFICLLNNLATGKMVDYFKRHNIEVFIYGVLNENKDLNYQNTFYIVNQAPIMITNKKE